MPYNSETETFYQAPATVVDSTPDGDTVQEGFDGRLTPAMAGVYADFNLLKADGMIGVGIPATTTSRGIGRVATLADMEPGAVITEGPAFITPKGGVITTTPTANAVPKADASGKLDGWVSLAGKANNDLSNVDLKVVLQPSMTGSATLNGTTNNTVQLTGIVTTLGLEVGAVIRIQYSGYDKLHSVESITNNNLIVVNYEHAGNRGNGSLKLANTTASATITRIAKWYNAPIGLGQEWVDMTDRRSLGTNYTNTAVRLQILVQYQDSGSTAGATFEIGSLSRTVRDLEQNLPLWFSAVIPNGNTYRISGGVNIPAWWELR